MKHIEKKIKLVKIFFDEYLEIFYLISSVKGGYRQQFYREISSDNFNYEIRLSPISIQFNVYAKRKEETIPQAIPGGLILQIQGRDNVIKIEKPSFLTDENVETFFKVFEKEFSLIKEEVLEKVEEIKINVKELSK